ncbi:MAG: serine/threonine protein kinase [Candidatus Obscuribacterales bacterium]|nr:serine/threonine protein kinase [Candidatus Obscuribacterales bacterium]
MDGLDSDKNSLLEDASLKRLGELFDGRYKLLRVLGCGGRAVVYEALHLNMETKVALKLIKANLLDDEKTRARFKNEAKLVMKLSHPNIVQVSAFGFSLENEPYIAMELLKGEGLDQLLKRSGKLPASQALSIIKQVLSGLLEAHQHSIIHRDLKPSNIFISEGLDGELLVKILDFGLAKSLSQENAEPQLTLTARPLGTPAYMSPEQCRTAELSAPSDIYSLGCVFFECLTGVSPFLASSAYELMSKHLSEPPRFPKCIFVSKELSAIVLSCLEKDPTHRISGTDLLSKLQSLGDSDGSRSEASSIKNWTIIFLAAILLTGLMSYAGLTSLKISQSQKSQQTGNSIKNEKRLGLGFLPKEQLVADAKVLRSGAGRRLPDSKKAQELLLRAIASGEKQIDEAKVDSSQIAEITFVVNALCVYSECCEDTEDFIAAKEALIKAKKLAARLNEPTLAWHVEFEKLIFYERSGDLVNALSKADKMLAIEDLDGPTRVDCFRARAIALRELGRYSESIESCNDGMAALNALQSISPNIYENESNSKQSFDFCHADALVLKNHNKKELQSYLHVFFDDLSAARTGGRALLSYRILIDLRETGQYELLEDACNGLIEKFEATEPTVAAMALSELERAEIAKSDFEKALQIEKRAGILISKKKPLISALLGMARARRLFAQGEREEAHVALSESMRPLISSELYKNQEAAIAVVLCFDACACARNFGDLKEEQFWDESAVQKVCSRNYIPGQRKHKGELLMRLAEISNMLGDKKLAADYANQAQILFELLKESYPQLWKKSLILQAKLKT